MNLKRNGATALIVISVVYLLNPTAGLFELLPDNIPFIGHVDETLALYLLFASIQYLRTGDFRLFKSILTKKTKR